MSPRCARRPRSPRKPTWRAAPARRSAPPRRRQTEGAAVSAETAIPPGARRLSFPTRFFNGFSYFLGFFYAQVVGLPAATVGLAIMFAFILDAFIDPVIGQLSDNTRSRWGRRHPFMYLPALPVGASFLL